MFWRTVSIITVSSIMAALATFAVILRFLARAMKSVSYDADDYLVVAGLVRSPLMALAAPIRSVDV